MFTRCPPDAMSAEQDDRPEPLDAQALDRLRELDPDGRQGVVQRVLAAYDTSLTRMVLLLRLQAEAPDADVVAGIAHTLKSSSASVGALALSRACADLEARLRGGQAADLRHDIERIVVLAEAAQRAAAAILRA
jgi:HPt (histidine-containing phosphotransfer) domain-containing protein